QFCVSAFSSALVVERSCLVTEPTSRSAYSSNSLAKNSSASTSLLVEPPATHTDYCTSAIHRPADRTYFVLRSFACVRKLLISHFGRVSPDDSHTEALFHAQSWASVKRPTTHRNRPHLGPHTEHSSACQRSSASASHQRSG